jgi:hypothetical protein
MVAGLISRDPERAFLLFNITLIAFGIWCFFWPVLRGWPSAIGLAWLWVAIELLNGVGHPLWSLRQGGYTPGFAAAPVLLVLAIYPTRRLVIS